MKLLLPIDRSAGLFLTPCRLPARQRRHGGSNRQRGYVMVLSMMILLLITIMSISMAKSFFMEEGMAGNVREKNRSFLAAQAALTYGEEFVKFGGTPVSCTVSASPASSTALTSLQVCSNGIIPTNSPNGGTIMPLEGYFPVPASYLSMVISNTGGQDKFFTPPGVYIQFRGTVLGGGSIFTITAFGYGGTQNSVSIVTSNFYVKPTAVSKGIS